VSPMSPMSPVSDMTRVNSHENRVATTEFSRFDQGPMDDMPAAMPRDSIDDDANDAPDSPVKTHFDQRDHAQLSAHRDQQTPNEGFVTPLERRDVHPDAASIVSEDERDHEPDQQQQIQDRWAQIRENAQRRAAARVSEEQSRPSQSARTDDDGATSEEESKFWFLRASSITRVLTKSSQPSNHAWLVSKPVLPSLLATWTIPLSRVAEIHPITHASSLADANSPNDRT
jgi:hypothetical protein